MNSVANRVGIVDKLLAHWHHAHLGKEEEGERAASEPSKQRASTHAMQLNAIALTNLARGQPERPLASRVLTQHRNHALKRAQHCAVHDDGTVA